MEKRTYSRKNKATEAELDEFLTELEKASISKRRFIQISGIGEVTLKRWQRKTNIPTTSELDFMRQCLISETARVISGDYK